MKNYIISALIGLSVGISATASFIKYTQPEVKVSCPPPVCPPCNPAIDFDKVKNFRGSLILKQTYQIDSDSTFRNLIIKDIQSELSKLKVSRCK